MVNTYRTGAVYISITTRRSKLTIIRVSSRLVTNATIVNTEVCGSLEALERLNLDEPLTGEDVLLISGLVELDSTCRVRLVHERTNLTVYRTITEVIHRVTVLVNHDVTLRVTNVQRIDRRHEVADIEQVTTGIRSILILFRILHISVAVAHVRSDLEPFLSLIVHVDTTRCTAEIRVLDNTAVIKERTRSEVRQLVG